MINSSHFISPTSFILEDRAQTHKIDTKHNGKEKKETRHQPDWQDPDEEMQNKNDFQQEISQYYMTEDLSHGSVPHNQSMDQSMALSTQPKHSKNIQIFLLKENLRIKNQVLAVLEENKNLSYLVYPITQKTDFFLQHFFQSISESSLFWMSQDQQYCQIFSTMTDQMSQRFKHAIQYTLKKEKINDEKMIEKIPLLLTEEINRLTEDLSSLFNTHNKKNEANSIEMKEKNNDHTPLDPSRSTDLKQNSEQQEIPHPSPQDTDPTNYYFDKPTVLIIEPYLIFKGEYITEEDKHPFISLYQSLHRDTPSDEFTPMSYPKNNL